MERSTEVPTNNGVNRNNQEDYDEDDLWSDILGPMAFFSSWIRRNNNNNNRRGNNNNNDTDDPVAAFANAAANVAAAAMGTTTTQDNQQQQYHPKPTPACRRAIRQLPTILVTPQDLVDESNRECCICLEEHVLKQRVTRLPCAHIFHAPCILDWLWNHSCTCPVCRFELETADPNYERGRLRRMRLRKPRFAMYELERLSISQLKELISSSSSQPQFLEKSELIRAIVDSGRVEIVAAPEPVPFRLSDLRNMGVGQLRRTMNDAGVFFDPLDVLEKQDMLTIFLNSGRLQLIEEEQQKQRNEIQQNDNCTNDEMMNDSKIRANGTASPMVEMVSDDEDEDNHNNANQDTPDWTASTVLYEVESPPVVPERPASEPPQRPDPPLASPAPRHAESLPVQRFHHHHHSNDDPHVLPVDLAAAGVDDDDFVLLADDLCDPPTAEQYDDDGDCIMASSTDETTTTPQPAEEPPGNHPMFDEARMPVDPPATISPPNNQQHTQEQQDAEMARQLILEDLRRCSIAELRTLALQRNVDLSDCIERSEMMERIAQASQQQQNTLSLLSSNHWSVSELRALARQVKVDLSKCRDQQEMIRVLEQAADEQPHVAEYIRALQPLARLSIPELRTTARQWQVSVADCLEKGEMIHRLVATRMEMR